MFSNLVSLILGYPSEEEAQRAEDRLTSRLAEDDDWVLVDRDDSIIDLQDLLEQGPESVLEDRLEDLQHLYMRSSTLPTASLEESWFLTPPPIFTSTGQIQVETSPFENLLIEHPSMSVYHQHSHPLFVARRHNLVPEPQEPVENSFSENIEVLRDTENEDIVEVQAPRQNRVEAMREEERQRHRNRQTQRIQIQKACQTLKRGYLERTNKAREVNCRNQRLRRGERSQGATRSYANNNRKC